MPPWSPLQHTGLYTEGDDLGGHAQVVSPGFCASQWGWGCTGNPGCGFCWLIPTGTTTRTVR